MKKIPVLFAGTASIGTPLLTVLNADDRFDIKEVITSPDRPAGRKMELKPSAIKEKALELNLSVFQPENINNSESIDHLKSLKAEIMVVIAYGQLLKPNTLDLFEHGCVNVHGSILPKYRGASPIQHALFNQDLETGISLMKMTKGMDEGPIYHVFKIPIADHDDSISLFDKLASLTAEKTPDALFEIITKNLIPQLQDEAEATYCTKILKSDGQINWNEPADKIEARIKAYAGWPGTFSFFNGKRLKIIKAKVSDYNSNLEPGTVFEDGNKVMVACQKNALELLEVQIEGKTPQKIDEFIRGYSDFLGNKLS